MDGKSNVEVSLSEDDAKNYTAGDCSVCCSNEETVSSTSWTNVSQSENESSTKLPATGNDCRRQETINALAWATCRAFKYRPSDPLHYLAYQLSRWRHGDVSYNFYETDLREDTCGGPSMNKRSRPRK